MLCNPLLLSWWWEGTLMPWSLLAFCLDSIILSILYALTGLHFKLQLKSTLREHLTREDRLAYRARILETLAAGTGEEVKVLQQFEWYLLWFWVLIARTGHQLLALLRTKAILIWSFFRWMQIVRIELQKMKVSYMFYHFLLGWRIVCGLLACCLECIQELTIKSLMAMPRKLTTKICITTWPLQLSRRGQWKSHRRARDPSQARAFSFAIFPFVVLLPYDIGKGTILHILMMEYLQWILCNDTIKQYWWIGLPRNWWQSCDLSATFLPEHHHIFSFDVIS